MRQYIAILIGILLLMPVALAETPGISGVLVSSTTESLDAPETGNLRLLQTKYDPYPAEPGQIVTLWVAVQNWGSDSIENAYLQVVPEYPFRLPQGNGMEEVGRIAGFGERLVEYELIVDEDAIEGMYAFDVQQCSDNTCSDVVRNVEIQISVKTGGSPRIKVGLEDTETFWGGKKGEVTLNIVNRGRLDIKFLTLTLLPSEDYEILSPTEIYVGELESDDFETTDFTIFVDEALANKDTIYIDLPVKIDYTDSNNHDYSSQAQVKLKIYSQEDLKRYGLMTDTNGSTTYLVASIVILGAGAWYWLKKKKKQH
jgi:LPXTG-motif cell wall-anchored protein